MRRVGLGVFLILAVSWPAQAETREELAGRLEARTQEISTVPYNGRWVPPGSATAWTMDCSNTTRWLYLAAAGHSLPRTASDQYESLRAARRLWRVKATDSHWRSKLRPGDLLFWENTYRPKRKPPITHVMVYLGRNADGSMRMAGSQGSRGVDIYTFRPETPYGGYTWFLWFKRHGRFAAFGRPL
jgi:cell wall-associated NlpC family hydrolase